MNRLISFFFLVGLALQLTACSYTTGVGQTVEKTFDLDAFDSIEMDGSFDVLIEQGAVQNVVAEGHENIIEKLRLSVLDGVLFISLEQGTYLNYELEIRLAIPDLRSASLDGSGEIRIGTFVNQEKLKIALDGSGDIETLENSVLEYESIDIELQGSGDVELKLKSKSVTGTLDGSGDVKLEGITDSFEAKLNGSGDIKAYDLEAISVQAQLDGSGSIKVYAGKQLDAQLNGSGDINYKGEPKVEASLDGSGSISAK